MSENKLIAVIGDEDMVTGLLLTGIGCTTSEHGKNFFVVDAKTTREELEAAYSRMMERDDVGLLLLSSRVAEMVRHLSARRVDDVLPVVLEVPEKDAAATSLASDPVFQRVAQMLGEEGAPKAGGAAGGRGE